MLTGTVATLDQKSKAVELASKAENVLRVEDDLLVPSTPAPATR
jgi:osmotically-inducible protein OsmY